MMRSFTVCAACPTVEPEEDAGDDVIEGTAEEVAEETATEETDETVEENKCRYC